MEEWILLEKNQYFLIIKVDSITRKMKQKEIDKMMKKIEKKYFAWNFIEKNSQNSQKIFWWKIIPIFISLLFLNQRKDQITQGNSTNLGKIGTLESPGRMTMPKK